MSKVVCCAFLLVSLVLVGCGAPAPQGGAGLSSAQVEDGIQVVKACEQTLQSLPAYRCDLAMAMHIEAQGMNNEMVSRFTVCVERPRRWAIVQKAGMMGGTSVSDGEQLISHAPMLQQYSVEDLPAGDLSELWEGSPMTAGILGPAAMVGSFMGQGLADWMLEGVDSSEYLGSDTIDGTQCQHYRFVQGDGMLWELWVELGEQALLRRFVITPDLSDAGGPAEGMNMSIQLDLTNWQLDAKPTDADFVYEPPAGHKKVDSLLGSLGEAPTVHPLVGEEAPIFEVSTLDGDTFSLQQELGQQVVVLDFWATWCGPCTKALPGLAEFAEDFADQGVAVYAVNQGEGPEKINEFLSEEQINLAVLLDSDGAVSDSYLVDGIPCTVVIGKDKRIQAVHVGYSGALERQLADEVKKLLAGEDLASETIERRSEQQK